MIRRAEGDRALDGGFEDAPSAPSRTLSGLVRHAERTTFLRGRDLDVGDWVLVRTRNSLYVLCHLGGGAFQVSGGWFDRNSEGPTVVRITGCTWGGRAILTGMVAAPGMFLEFDNGVGTTRILGIRLLRGGGATVH